MTNAEFVWSLKALTKFYEAHPNFPAPSMSIDVFTHSREEFVAAAREFSPCDKVGLDYWFCLRRMFGKIRLDVNVPRGEVCERVEVGVRHVEATPAIPESPAHDELVYKWRCDESILAPQGHAGREEESHGA
jgi:hypothetical protein